MKPRAETEDTAAPHETSGALLSDISLPGSTEAASLRNMIPLSPFF
jgi:hypothetical protein